MAWFKRNTPKQSEELYVARCEFVGEQDGSPERALKEKLADFFRNDGGVSRAYLAKASYDGGKNISVVLGLRTEFGHDKGVVEGVGKVFASIFNAKQHLDTIFLEDDQEDQLTKVCKPFFVQGEQPVLDTEGALFVPSVNVPHSVKVLGFERADDCAHMLEWLGRGTDFRKFVVEDIETELYRQTPGAQLLAVTCTADLDLRTDAVGDASDGVAVVTGLSVTFPITARVKAADGEIWKLEIQHNYEATGVNLGSGRKLRLNFGLKASSREMWPP